MRAEKGLSADLLVGQKVLYEIKPVECVGPTMHKSSRTFMRFTQVNVALVVNSHEVFLEDEIERPVLGPENYLFPQPTQ